MTSNVLPANQIALFMYLIFLRLFFVYFLNKILSLNLAILITAFYSIILKLKIFDGCSSGEGELEYCKSQADN